MAQINKPKNVFQDISTGLAAISGNAGRNINPLSNPQIGKKLTSLGAMTAGQPQASASNIPLPQPLPGGDPSLMPPTTETTEGQFSPENLKLRMIGFLSTLGLIGKKTKGKNNIKYDSPESLQMSKKFIEMINKIFTSPENPFVSPK